MFLVFGFSWGCGGFLFWLKSRIPKAKFRIPKKKSRIPSVFGFWFFLGYGGFSVNTVEREMTESAGLVKGIGFVRNFKPELSKEIESFYASCKDMISKANLSH